MCRRLSAERWEEHKVRAGLRTEIIQMRQERDEGRADRDQMTLKSAEMAEESEGLQGLFDAVSEGVAAMVAGNSKLLSMVGYVTKPGAERRSNSSEDILASATKKLRLDVQTPRLVEPPQNDHDAREEGAEERSEELARQVADEEEGDDDDSDEHDPTSTGFKIRGGHSRMRLQELTKQT